MGSFLCHETATAKMVIVVIFTGNISSNARESLDRENKQPVTVCSVVEGGGWKLHSQQLVLPALSLEKDPGVYHCPQSTCSFNFPTESTD